VYYNDSKRITENKKAVQNDVLITTAIVNY